MSDASTLMPAGESRSDASVLALSILYHPDISRVGERALLEGDAELSRTTPLFAGRALEDRYLSRSPIRIAWSGDAATLDAGNVERCAADGRALGGGAAAVWQKFDRVALTRGVVIELGERVVLLLHLVADRPVAAPSDNLGLVGMSDAMIELRASIARVADLDVPVLLRGESGSGKELVARAIHRVASRERPFIAINVAALPPSVAASELFGHTRGAFTGAATDHEGLFARAHGGTLFLDEIGETPADVQPMLLRALETGEIMPLGAAHARRVEVRLLAATDADLENQISENRFREALFHRLAGYQIHVPPLRERRDDIGRLLVAFLQTELAATGDLGRLERQRGEQRLWLPAKLVARLARFGWPGNVRQLRNAARQLAISNRGAEVAAADATLERMLQATAPVAPARVAEPTARRDPAAITDDDLVAALRAHGWRTAGAASQLGVSRSTLYMLIDRSKRIRKAKDISDGELRRVYDGCGGDLDAAAAQLEVSQRALKLRIGELGWDD